jgi:hypothetical protein
MQRKTIIGACWAQFPLFSAISFREFEASAVDVPSIYSGSSPDRLGWKTYLKSLFVEIADASYLMGVVPSKISDDICKKPVFELWRSLPLSEAVDDLNLSDAEDVPGSVGGRKMPTFASCQIPLVESFLRDSMKMRFEGERSPSRSLGLTLPRLKKMTLLSCSSFTRINVGVGWDSSLW